MQGGRAFAGVIVAHGHDHPAVGRGAGKILVQAGLKGHMRRGHIPRPLHQHQADKGLRPDHKDRRLAQVETVVQR